MKGALCIFVLISILSWGRTVADSQQINIAPQPGPQTAFLSTSADIAVYGGARGGGKSWAAMVEPIRHLGNARFGAVIFRREYPEIRNEGGLWDKSLELYPYLSGQPREGYMDWKFPSGAKIRFAHLQREDDVMAWRGAEIPLIIFDQLESFTWKQFWMMLSSNRSTCGVRPYVRATCNPDPDHPLRQFLIDGGYINEESGYAIKRMSGVIRWFARVSDDIFWADSKEILEAKFGDDISPKSFTFIRSSVYDNKILLEKDPGYLANLRALPRVDRERHLGDIEKGGNWNVRETAGMFFQPPWFQIVEAAPALIDAVRYWDRAATETKPGDEKRASWTAGLRMGKSAAGVFYITDVARFQGTPLTVEQQIANIATQDTKSVRIGIEEDPGQAGKAEAQMYVRKLAGYNISVNRVHERKGVRARPLSAQAEAGNVKLVRGSWNEAFLREAQNFDGTEKCVSDQVDAASGAFHLLTARKLAGIWGMR